MHSLKSGAATVRSLPVSHCLLLPDFALHFFLVCSLLRNRLSAHQHREKERLYKEQLEAYVAKLTSERDSLKCVGWLLLFVVPQ